jgi:hypothetical protein
MQRVIAGKDFAAAVCNPPDLSRAFIHNTPIARKIKDYLSTHTEFTTLDLRQLGLNKQSVQYHISNAEDAGLVVKLPKGVMIDGVHWSVYAKV